MNHPLSRRDALKAVISAGTMALIKPARAADSETPIISASAPVDISVFSISPRTVRITIQPIQNGSSMPLPSDGALVREEWPTRVARVRSLTTPRTMGSGEL
ncbi:MAG: hypothetical protein ABR905_21855, partial [Terracidiphilus sp.]